MVKPDLSKPEVILALPVISFGRVSLVTDANCEATYKGRTLRSSEPGWTIHIPVAPQFLAHFVEDSDLLFATDEDGDQWAPVLTETGWARRCVNGWSKLGDAA